jgi:hypothetical protein
MSSELGQEQMEEHTENDNDSEEDDDDIDPSDVIIK